MVKPRRSPSRILQAADGDPATLINGIVTGRNDGDAAACAGRLNRATGAA